ncbi:MAG: hypothetical protein ACK4TI_02725 [Nitrososphaerales archaeon]
MVARRYKKEERIFDIMEDGAEFLESVAREITSLNVENVKLKFREVEIVLTDEISPNDRFFMLWSYHRAIYMNQNLSGDVKFYRFKTPIFKQDNPQNVVFLAAVYNRTYTSYPRLIKMGVKGVSYVFFNYDAGSGTTFGARIFILFSVSRNLGEEFKYVVGVEDQEEIMKRVLAAARISKTASRILIPIHDLHGNITDAVPAGNEDTIFAYVLTHLLAELRRKRIEGGIGNVS